MLPVWLLIVPTVTHGIMQYMIGTATSTITSQVLRRYYRQDQQKQVVRLLFLLHCCWSIGFRDT